MTTCSASSNVRLADRGRAAAAASDDGGAGGERRLGTALALLALALAVTAALLYVLLGDRLSFFNDDWYFLLQRPGLESGGGLDTLLAPHNGNLVLIPAALYKLLVLGFGLSHQWPFHVMLALAIAALGLLLFAAVSRRAGPLLGLCAAAIVLFLGVAWEDLLFFASIDLVGSLVAGLAALAVVEAPTRRRDILACLLVTVSLACSNLGVAFGVGVAVWLVLVRRRPRDLWIVAIPAVLFVIWWAIDGHRQPAHFSLANLRALPHYIADSASAGAASLAGISAGTEPTTYHRGAIVLVVAALGAVAARRQLTPRWRRLLVPGAGLLCFWLLTGLGFYPGREPFASRYQLIDATFMLLLVAELLGRPGTGAVAAGGAAPLNAEAHRLAVAAPLNAEAHRLAGAAGLCLTAVVVFLNLANGLTDGYGFLRTQSAYVRADLGALALASVRGIEQPGAGRPSDADVQLTEAITHTPYLSGITLARYRAETAAHGRPAGDSLTQLAAAPEAIRQSADGVLIAAEAVHPAPGPGPSAQPGRGAPSGSRAGCRRVGNMPGDRRELALSNGTTVLHNRSATGLAISVRRLAGPGFSSGIALIGPDASEHLVISADAIGRPWRLSVRGASAATAATLSVCRA